MKTPTSLKTAKMGSKKKRNQDFEAVIRDIDEAINFVPMIAVSNENHPRTSLLVDSNVLESKQHAIRPNDIELIIKDSEDQKVGASTLVTNSMVIMTINFTVGSNNNPNLKSGRGGSNRGQGKSKNINHSPCVS